jgi:hypothetical protein
LGNVRVSENSLKLLRSRKEETGSSIEFLVGKAIEVCYSDKESAPRKQAKAATQFKAPDPQDISAYFIERGCVDLSQPEKFFNFYSSKGWMVGKSKMKDWKAAARNWIARNKGDQNGKRQSLSSRSEQATKALFAQLEQEEASSGVLGEDDSALRLQMD